MEEATIREAVAVFDSEENLDAAVAELGNAAFPRHDISVAGRKEKSISGGTMTASELEDNPEAPRHVPVMPEEKNMGAAFIAGVCAYIGGCVAAYLFHTLPPLTLLAGITAGSLIGGTIGLAVVLTIRDVINNNIQRQIEKGGLVLWVHTVGAKAEETACAIMRKHGGRHVHVHNIQ